MIEISIEQAHEKVQNGEAIILDIREPYEHEICSIESLNIPMADVVNCVDKIPMDKLVIVMCRTGKRAEAVANILITEYNLTNVTVMQGGIIAWIESFATHLEKY